MKYQCATVSILCILYCASVFCHGLRSGNRVRRIVNGQPLTDDNIYGYSAIRYFVWISNPHRCAYYERLAEVLEATAFEANLFERFGLDASATAIPEDVLCGGALLTSKIVQTACHCLASFSQAGNQSIQPYIVNDAFTDRTMAFVGYTSTEMMKKGYMSKRYIVHQKCAKHNTTKYVFHDYGVIVLKKSFSPDPHKKLNLAPLYKQETMAYLWNKLSIEETVCLFVGYGQIDERDETYSAVMRHSWGVIRNYAKCFQWTNIKQDFNYTEDATWYCQTALPNTQAKPRLGDFGSPVTCNNDYVGLLSWHIDGFSTEVHTEGSSVNFNGTSNVSGSSATVFSAFENAQEFRHSFMKQMSKLDPS